MELNTTVGKTRCILHRRVRPLPAATKSTGPTVHPAHRTSYRVCRKHFSSRPHPPNLYKIPFVSGVFAAAGSFFRSAARIHPCLGCGRRGELHVYNAGCGSCSARPVALALLCGPVSGLPPPPPLRTFGTRRLLPLHRRPTIPSHRQTTPSRPRWTTRRSRPSSRSTRRSVRAHGRPGRGASARTARGAGR